MEKGKTVTGKFGLKLVQGEPNERGELCAIPPARIQKILARLLAASPILISIGEVAGKQKTVMSIEQLPERERAALNKFAASVAGVKDCKVRSVDGCGSCILGGKPGKEGSDIFFGTIAVTDCGVQCWYCCTD